LLVETFAPPFETGDFGVEGLAFEEHTDSF
jgi:hypothetical protein